MPADTVKKVANTCDMSISEVEDKWKKAKEKAESQGHAEDWGYITSIFKNMLSKNCLEKLGWNNNKKESNTMSANRLLEKIDKYLNEGKAGDMAEKISQKIITSSKLENEIERLDIDYNNEPPKKVIDKMAKKVLNSKEFKFYQDNFDIIKPILVSDLGIDKIKNVNESSKIDWDQVKEAGKKVAKKIHGEADEKVINDMISKIKKNNKAKDTEDAIQIITNMLKS